MLGSTRRSLILMGLLLSLGVAVLLAAAGLDWRTLGSRQILLLAVAATGLCMIALAANSIWRIHARLERLRGHVALAASDTPLPPILTEAPDSIDRLHLAVADLIGRRRAAQAELDRRLEQIMGALPDPVLVVTPEGLVSLVNAAGRALFAERSSMVGTSVYDLLTEGGLAAAMAESRSRGVAVDCRLDLLTGESLEASVSAFTSDPTSPDFSS